MIKVITIIDPSSPGTVDVHHEEISTSTSPVAGNRVLEFTSNGSFVVPAGITQIYVEGIGAGGGSGGSGSVDTLTATYGAGPDRAVVLGTGGGGAGEYVRVVLQVSEGETINVTVGTGGAAGVAGVNGVTVNGMTGSGGDGGDGGDTTLVGSVSGNLLTIHGGQGSVGTQPSSSRQFYEATRGVVDRLSGAGGTGTLQKIHLDGAAGKTPLETGLGTGGQNPLYAGNFGDGAAGVYGPSEDLSFRNPHQTLIDGSAGNAGLGAYVLVIY